MTNKVKVIVSSKDKKIGRKGYKPFSGDVKISISNKRVLKLSRGMLFPMKKGKCTVRFIAENGVISVPMKVVVKGHKEPGKFTIPKEDVYDSRLQTYLNPRSNELYKVTEGAYGLLRYHVALAVHRTDLNMVFFENQIFNDIFKKSIKRLFEDKFFDSTFRLSRIYFDKMDLIYLDEKSYDLGCGNESLNFVFYSTKVESSSEGENSYLIKYDPEGSFEGNRYWKNRK